MDEDIKKYDRQIKDASKKGPNANPALLAKHQDLTSRLFAAQKKLDFLSNNGDNYSTVKDSNFLSHVGSSS